MSPGRRDGCPALAESRLTLPLPFGFIWVMSAAHHTVRKATSPNADLSRNILSNTPRRRVSPATWCPSAPTLPHKINTWQTQS